MMWESANSRWMGLISRFSTPARTSRKSQIAPSSPSSTICCGLRRWLWVVRCLSLTRSLLPLPLASSYGTERMLVELGSTGGRFLISFSERM
jgi:hypothetical protein